MFDSLISELGLSLKVNYTRDYTRVSFFFFFGNRYSFLNSLAHRVSEDVPSTGAYIWPWDSQIAQKKLCMSYLIKNNVGRFFYLAMYLTFSHRIPISTLIATISSGAISAATIPAFIKIFFVWSSSNDFSNFSVFPHVLLSCPIKNLLLRNTVFDETFSLPLTGFGVDVKYIGQGKKHENLQKF